MFMNLMPLFLLIKSERVVPVDQCYEVALFLTQKSLDAPNKPDTAAKFLLSENALARHFIMAFFQVIGAVNGLLTHAPG